MGLFRDRLSNFSQDEIRNAALKIIWNERPRIPSKSWLGGTLESCDGADEQVVRLRHRYATYEPIRIRRAIMRWLDYFEAQAEEARRDIVSQKSKLELGAYRERERHKSSRVRELMRVLSES